MGIRGVRRVDGLSDRKSILEHLIGGDSFVENHCP